MNAFSTPSNEPPPDYSTATQTPALSIPSSSSARPGTSYSTASQASANITTSTSDDQFAFLGHFDTVFLIDDSGSMAGRSWRECSAALEKITPLCTKYDADGIDIHFLNARDEPHFKNVTDPTTIHEIFNEVRPWGSTPTGVRLNRIMKDYIKKLRQAEKAHGDCSSVKPLNIIVITDGDPSDDLQSPLINAAHALDDMEDAEPWQMGVQFVQVGEEPEARRLLESLDDDLSKVSRQQFGKPCRDIVDTVPYNGRSMDRDTLVKVVLGGVNKRYDMME
ncbi:MAG: hypothetical protein Q9159_007271, partial [Coniocarpon cinnabarinum]